MTDSYSTGLLIDMPSGSEQLDELSQRPPPRPAQLGAAAALIACEHHQGRRTGFVYAPAKNALFFVHLSDDCTDIYASFIVDGENMRNAEPIRRLGTRLRAEFLKALSISYAFPFEIIAPTLPQVFDTKELGERLARALEADTNSTAITFVDLAEEPWRTFVFVESAPPGSGPKH